MATTQCHTSCSTCSGSTFIQCLTCPTGTSFVNGACFCDNEWDSTCTYKSISIGLDVTLQSFYTILFALVIFLYYFKIRLPYSYRIVTGMQALSLMVFSSKIYLYFENQFMLRYLAQSHGYYNYQNRIQGLNINYAIGPLVLLGCFLFVYFLGLYLTNTFRTPSEEYSDYLGQNFVHLMYSFYFFASRMMFYYIGEWINSMTFTASIFIPFCLFAVIIVLTLIKLFYDFHKDKLAKDEVYEPEILLYLMLQSISMLGLPLVQNQLYYLIIYLSPISLMVLIVLINRTFQVFTKAKILFYVIEVLIAGLTVAFILLKDPYRYYVLLVTVVLAIVGIVVELIYTYYSGVQLCSAKSNKVHPEPQARSEASVVSEEQLEGTKYKKKRKSAGTVPVSRKSYF